MAFERQRDLHFQHVANLADMLEHDEWVGMSVLLFASEGRDTWLIDIQHRRRPHVEFGRWVEAEVPGTRSFGSFPTIRLRPRRCSCRARTRVFVVVFVDLVSGAISRPRCRSLQLGALHRRRLVMPASSVDGSNPAISGHRKSGHFRRPETGVEFYLTAPCVGKVVWTLVRQLRGPHFSTCA